MKRTLFAIFAAAAIVALAAPAMAAGTVTAEWTHHGQGMRSVTLTCTGDSSDGSIPDTSFAALTEGSSGRTISIMSKVDGHYLYRVFVKNTSAQADPTANSDVYLKNAAGTDYLGGKGVDALDNDAENKINLIEPIRANDPLTFSVANNSGASSVFTVTFVFVE